MIEFSTLYSYQYFVIAVLIGAASGVVGAFVILKRMALVGDALSHVALPGIALALAWQIDPFWGALALLLVSAFFVWWLEGRTKLPGDAIIGLLFTASLAVGILGIADEEILHSLFGSFVEFSPAGFALVSLAALGIIAVTCFATRRILFEVAVPDLAAAFHKSRFATLLFLILFSSVVALGIKLVGTLLMGALTIIPASIAKNVSRSMAGYVVLSGALGGIIAGAGVWVALRYGFAPGPVIILLGVFLFIATVFFSKR